MKILENVLEGLRESGKAEWEARRLRYPGQHHGPAKQQLLSHLSEEDFHQGRG